MGNLHLVTGCAGRSHVSAADMASLFEALVRGGEFVMAAGANFGAAIISNNQIRVSDGELMMQGRHVKLDPGTYVDMVIENGEQGLLRHDLIVARYTRNVEIGIEDCNLIAIKGTSVESDPADPKYITGSINAEGATVHDMPLYCVVLSGLNIEKLQPLFEPQVTLFESLLSKAGGTMTGAINMDGNRITGLGKPVDENDAVPKSYVAPAGYGLGTQNPSQITSLHILDNTGYSGWYELRLDNENILGYKQGLLYVNASALVIEQVFEPHLLNGKLVRYWNVDHGWGEWCKDTDYANTIGLPYRNPPDGSNSVTADNIDGIATQGIYYTEIGKWVQTIVFNVGFGPTQLQIGWDGTHRTRIQWGGVWTPWDE